MPWDDPKGRVTSHTAWRIVIVLLALAVAALWALVPFLFATNRHTIQATTDLSCRLGTFFVGEPITRQPQQTEPEFQRVVAKAQGFLVALKHADCSGVPGASITKAQIHRQIHALERIKHGGG